MYFNVPLWNEIFTNTWFSSLKTLLLQSFRWISPTRFAELVQFWQDPKCRRKRTFWRKKFSVSLEKDFIFRFHIYFSASFASYFQQLKQLLSTEWLNITLLNFVRLSTLSIKKGSHKRYMQHSQLQQQFEHSGPSRSSFDLSCTDKPAKSKTAAVYRLIEYIYIYLYKYIYI